MARIAICWELGRGLGHIVRYRRLIRQLLARGDEVVFLAAEKRPVAEVLKDMAVEVVELERGFTAPANRIRGVDSYPEILYNCGFHDPDVLYPRMNRVATLLRQIAPDMLVTDFAPTVMLANVNLRLPVILSGNGFTVPVLSTPMRRFRYWLGGARQTLLRNENRVLDVVNRVLARAGWQTLNSVSAMLRADCAWLLIFAELDFYGARNGVRYLGSFPDELFGQAPVWPAAGDVRVFAYLTPGSTSTAALGALVDLGASVCLYAPKFTTAERRACDSPSIHWASAPVDIAAAGREVTLFMNNGNLNSVAAALLAGKAQLALPTTTERYLSGRRLELLGAGLAAPRTDAGNIPAKLRALLTDKQFTRAAQRFAKKYCDASIEDQTRLMLIDIDRVLSR